MRFFFRFFFFLITNSIIFWAIHKYSPFPNLIVGGGWQAFVVTGFIFGLTNSVLSPILNFILFPLHYFVLGLFRFVVNAVVLWGTVFLVNTANINQITLEIKGGVLWYVFFGAIIGCMNAMVHSVFRARSNK